MATLSHDMTLEILRGLSVKDLLCFKCVSKLWCSWLEDPYFIKLHLKTNTNHSLIVCYRRDYLNFNYPTNNHFLSVNCDSLETTRRLEHPVGDQQKCIVIWGSCNGLLAGGNNGRIFLWNPSTGKSQVLTSTEIEISCSSTDDSESRTFYGFGYEPVSDDYKLVLIVQFRGRHGEFLCSEAKVYSLRSNCWRRIEDCCFHLDFQPIGRLVNNALHWKADGASIWSNYKKLVGFDLGSEEFRVVELPDFCLNKHLHYNVKAMGGYLCLKTTHRELSDLWIMKGYGVKESWVQLMPCIRPDILPIYPLELLLGFSKNGDKILFHNRNSPDNWDRLVWYDLGSKRVEKVGNRALPYFNDVLDLYVESLVSPRV